MNAAKVLEDLKRRFPNEPEYHQAVEEVLSTIEEEYNKHPEFDKVNLIERLCIPDRVYQFRVTWMDDKGNIQTNMGYRVQHNNAIGPYKGGIRFHSSVRYRAIFPPRRPARSAPDRPARSGRYPTGFRRRRPPCGWCPSSGC